MPGFIIYFFSTDCYLIPFMICVCVCVCVCVFHFWLENVSFLNILLVLLLLL